MFEKHRKNSFITLLIVPRLSKHERSGTIQMLQAGLSVTDIAQYYNCHPSTIQVLRDRNNWDGKRSTPVWSIKNYNMSSRRYIDSVLRPVTLSSLRQNQRRANFIDQHDIVPAHTLRLSVNFQASNIILVLCPKTCLRLSYKLQL